MFHNVLKIQARMARNLDRFLGRRPSSAPFLSGDTFRTLARWKWDEEESPNFGPEAIQAGDIVFVSWHLGSFLKDLASQVAVPFILVTSNSDQAIGAYHGELLEKTPIVRWYAVNVQVFHPKIVPIPLGLENARSHWYGEVTDFHRLRRFMPQAKTRFLCWGFAVKNNPTERESAQAVLRSLEGAEELKALDPFRYRRRLCQYALVASPPGNGPDCHRTWEALYLGVVPVVRKSVLTEAFVARGIPLVQLDRWEDLSNLVPPTQPFSEPKALFFEYWKNLILADHQAARKGVPVP